MNYIIVSEKPWNKKLVNNLSSIFPLEEWYLISDQNQFTIENLRVINPVKIFIPHWSYVIPADIFNEFECIVFHMTDLPYGRGGSPLQNLIIRGHDETKITALKVCKGIDAGDIYLKKSLCLLGTAEEIFLRANAVIESMIIEIVQNNMRPIPQEGDIVIFKRRQPTESSIENIDNIESLYDFIRMLDAENYPKAYIENSFFRFEFSRATLKADETILSDVRISKK